MEHNHEDIFNDVLKDLMIVSKAQDVETADFENIIQIVDETGNEVNCTFDKFVEIFDKEGLSGFIL